MTKWCKIQTSSRRSDITKTETADINLSFGFLQCYVSRFYIIKGQVLLFFVQAMFQNEKRPTIE